MKRTGGADGRPARGAGRNLGKALVSLAVLAAVVAALTAVRLHREGYFFRNLRPADWWLQWRGVYRFDPERHVVRQGTADRPMVALTFDDGPNDRTSALLDILDAHDARATFFLVGSNVLKRPDVVRRMAAEGHDLGNHTRTHLRLPPLPDHQIRNEISYDNVVIERVARQRPRLFRPPGGRYDERVLAEAQRQGMATVLWTNNTGDWRIKDPAWIANRVLSNVENGDIILMHEQHGQTLAALPAIIDGLRRRGFRVVSVSEMMEASGYGLPPLPSPAVASVRSGSE